MKNLISGLNKIFDNRIRLGIMSILMVNDWVDFNAIKEILELTDGNLSSNISHLEKNGFIETKKQFLGKKPKTSYRVTIIGRHEFTKHIDALEAMIKEQKI
jgi:DNA-binding MarR family transcriptional regulator